MMKDPDTERKQRLAPYGKMDGEQLLKAYCDNAELREEFGGSHPEFHGSAFNGLILFIRRNYPHSPIQQEGEMRYLAQVEDVELKIGIRQRQEAGETRNQKHRETLGGEWSDPMTKSAMMSKIGIDGYKSFNTFAKQHGLRQAGSRQLWQIRLDRMDKNTRQKFEKT